MQNNAEKSNQDQAVVMVGDGDHSIVKAEQAAVDEHEAIQNNKKPILHGQFFAGPIPPPELLAKYNKIIPNGADRIFKLTEQQQAHRHHLEKAVVESDIKRSNWGLLLGFVLTLLFGAGGIYLVSQGQSINGLAVIFGPLAALAGVFIYAKSSRKRELKSSNHGAEKNDAERKNSY